MKLFVWLPTYPNVMISMLVAFAKSFKGEVCIVCPAPVSHADADRYAAPQITDSFRIIIFNRSNFDKIVHNTFRIHMDAIHIFCGMVGNIGRALTTYANEYNGKNAYIFTERPSVSPALRFNLINKWLRLLYSKMIYKSAYEKASSAIKAIFVTGERGVSLLHEFGIPVSKLFEIMYTHNDGESLTATENIPHKTDKIVHFVYVGRFEFLNRGLDTLIAACDKIKLDNWHLDLIGGYGKDSEEIIRWAEKTNRVSYLGEWKNCDVVKNLSAYDVCISPTRIDGWRIQVNQAIVAGCATITTTEAISDELVRISHSGIVIPPGNAKKLRQAMEYAISNPEKVALWKRNAFAFREKISNEIVGKYMNDVINFCQTKQGKRPVCPWQEK